MPRAAIGGEPRLQLGHFRAEDELAMRQHRLEPRRAGSAAMRACCAFRSRNGIGVDQRSFLHGGRSAARRAPSALCSNSGTRRPSSASAEPRLPGAAGRGDLVDRAADDRRVGGARGRPSAGRDGRSAPAARWPWNSSSNSFSPGRRPVNTIGSRPAPRPAPAARPAGSSAAPGPRSAPACPCRARRCRPPARRRRRRRCRPRSPAAPGPTASRTVMK